MDKKPLDPPERTTCVDVLVKCMNFKLLLFSPRKVTNFRWANSARDALEFAGHFAKDQFTQVYGRHTSRYKYHRLQQWENLIRKFDLTEPLAARLHNLGNRAFYQAISDYTSDDAHTKSEKVDLTRIQDICTATSSANYLYNEVLTRKGERAAKIARKTYLAGYSRPIDVFDYDDWEAFRTELRNSKHTGVGLEDVPGESVMLIALSYKGNKVEITRRMRPLDKNGKPVDVDDSERVDDEGWIHDQEKIQLTSDFVDDFRWSQVVRSCMALAKKEGVSTVRLWIDRLIRLGLSEAENTERNNLIDWEEYGLFSYAVCPVVRVYDSEERYFQTDFWRKLETVLGVAGKGVIVDDYMLRKYDGTLFFGPSMYRRLDRGISWIGGGGIYLKGVTLALATAVMTDGVTVSAVNEDIRTKEAIEGWKAWALRTIGEGAYSVNHCSMMRQEDAYTVRYGDFMTIAFWESLVSQSDQVTGNSYLDMSIQRSVERKKSSRWDGILEWIGRMGGSCRIEDRDNIMEFLNNNVLLSAWTSTSGHVAAILRLNSLDAKHRRSIVVDLARFSTVKRGHVTAIGEATGLWGGSILPSYLKFYPDADTDQKASIGSGGIEYEYENMKVGYACCHVFGIIMLGCFLASPILFFVLAGIAEGGAAIFAILGVLIWIGYALRWLFTRRTWPWVDKCDVGEAVFDNLLLHSLYGAGIKEQYRRLEEATYRDITWT